MSRQHYQTYRPPTLDRRQSDLGFDERSRDASRDRERTRKRDRDDSRDRDRDRSRDQGQHRGHSWDRGRDIPRGPARGGERDRRPGLQRESSLPGAPGSHPAMGRRASNASSTEASSSVSATAPPPLRKPASAAQQPSSTSSASARDKQVLDLAATQSLRTWWFFQLHKARKSRQECETEKERIKARNPDYISALEALDEQRKNAADTEAKANARFQDVDRDITAAFGAILEGQSQDFEARLQKQEETFNARLQAEVAKLRAESQQVDVAQISKLSARIDELSEKNRQLEAQLENVSRPAAAPGGLEETLQELDRKTNSFQQDINDGLDRKWATVKKEYDDGLASVQAIKDKLSEHEAVERGLLERLQSLEEALMPIKSSISGQDLSGVLRDISNLTTETNRLGAAITQHEHVLEYVGPKLISLYSTVSSLPATVDLERITTDVMQLKEQLSSPRSQIPNEFASPASAPMSDKRVDDLVNSKLVEMSTDFKGRFQKMAQTLGNLIDNERKERETMNGRLQAMGEQGSFVTHGLQETKQNHATFAAEIRNMIQRHVGEIASVQQNIMAFAHNLAEVDQRITTGIKDCMMQLTCIVAWQNNFSTRSLYREIVDHIKATMPPFMDTKLEALAARVQTVEARVATDGSGLAKKRRLQNGEAVRVNGSERP